MKQIKDCGISEAKEFHTLWKLPNFPLTELVGKFDPNVENYDQELVISVPTGHVQLKNQLDISTLYTVNEYSYRTGAIRSDQAVVFFKKFVEKVSKGKIFNSIVDIGGNDLALLRQMMNSGKSHTVIDPICASLDGETIDDIKVIGKFIEEVNLSDDLVQPDLVICRHTMEHIARPSQVIRQWFDQCTSDAIYIIEIPCFENLVESLRFDAVFHQHFQLFDLYSLKNLIWECGGEYIDHAHYHQGSCGGSLMIAFQKAKTEQPRPLQIDLEKRILFFEKRIAEYKIQMQTMGELLKELPGPVYGYGAGLMLATFAYHLNTDFKEIVCVLDDDAEKDGMTYRNVPVTIRSTEKVKPPKNSSYIITSMENLRPIYKRILDLNPRRILTPLIS